MDKKSIYNVWEQYLQSIGETLDSTTKTFEAWNFGDCEETCAKLLALVIKGSKKATSSTKINFEYIDEIIPSIDDLHVITNWSGEAKCVIKTTDVNIIPYGEVSEIFAAKAGEGDLSLKHWIEVHGELFSSDLKIINKEFSDETLIVCEEFELVYS